jgi:putative DNA primase/helicase
MSVSRKSPESAEPREVILGNRKAKPSSPLIVPENIPLELRHFNRWVGWRWEWDARANGGRGRWNKPPVNVRTGARGSSTKPRTWSSFAEAFAAYQRGEIDGIGFVLGELDDGRILTGIDLDSCRDPQSGEVSETAKSVVELVNTYTEVSPTGTGIKLFCFGTLPEGPHEKGHIECYDSGRYFTVTGCPIHLEPVRSVTTELERFYRTFIDPPSNTSGMSDRELALVALAGLSPIRADNYRNWINVGMALHSVDPALVEQWDEWSRQSEKYGDGICAQKWRSFNGHGLSLGSLIHWAKEDGWNLPPRTPPVHLLVTGSSKHPPLTDLGNAERFCLQHKADVRYLHAWDKWLVWDGTRWKIDVTGEVVRRAKATVRTIYREASEASDPKDAKTIAQWATTSQSSPRIDALLKLARSEHPIPITHDELDTDPWLLNCSNGTLDLRTGVLRPHARKDLLTKSTGVDYLSAAESEDPLWQAFLHKTFDENSILIGFMQRLMGLALVGEQLEHVAPIAYGTGANGKGVFTGTIQAALGDYAMTAPHGLLMSKRGEQHPTELADLFGKRLVTIAETKDGQRLDEGLVKAITGGDKIRARRMREDFWEFAPSHLVILVTNHKPIVRGADYGIWRRLLLIPFTVTIPDEQQDKYLPTKLQAELPGILKWMVEGCLAWQKHGLCVPAAVRAATEQYKSESDTFAKWFDEHMEVNAVSECRASRAFRSYKLWCEETGETPLTQTQFGLNMNNKITGKRTSNGVWYQGIQFQSTFKQETFGEEVERLE